MVGSPDTVNERSPHARPIMLKLVDAGRIRLGTLKARFYSISPEEITTAGLIDAEIGVLNKFELLRTHEADDFEIGFEEGPAQHIEIENSPTSTQKSLIDIAPLPTATQVDPQAEKVLLKKLINVGLLTLSSFKILALTITTYTAESCLNKDEREFLEEIGLLEEDEELPIDAYVDTDEIANQTRNTALENSGASKG